MSYDLQLRFASDVSFTRLRDYLRSRRKFEISEAGARYLNPDTGVYFTLEPERGALDRILGRAGAWTFSLNYLRPSYFALETDLELKALVAKFRPAIDDPQPNGLGPGPYASEAFLRGWRAGNLAALAVTQGHAGAARTLPQATLLDLWTWNLLRQERMDDHRAVKFLPTFMVWLIEGRVRTAVIWTQGIPTRLPKVDYVLVRPDVEVETFGLVAWDDVVALAARIGVDTAQTELDFKYEATPEPVTTWFAGIPHVDMSALTRLDPAELLEAEAVEAARRPTVG